MLGQFNFILIFLYALVIYVIGPWAMAGVSPAAGTELSGYSNDVLAGGQHGIRTESGRTTSANIKAGTLLAQAADTTYGKDVVEGTSHATTVASALWFLGVAAKRADTPLDDEFANNIDIEYYARGCGADVWIQYKTSGGALTRGEKVIMSPTAGISEKEIYTTPTTPDAAENKLANDQNRINQISGVGTVVEEHGDVAAVTWIKVRLNS